MDGRWWALGWMGLKARGAAFAFGLAVLPGAPALARVPFSCAGMAVAGGAELLCSHADPDAPPQTCSFSWTLMTVGNQQSVVSGSFLLPAGVTNSAVYQGSGFAYALSSPVVLCQGRKESFIPR